MLHIILLILKIIGIVLAVVLALLLLAVLAILFVPIRYRIKAGYQEKLTANVKVTWLLHLVRCYVKFDQKLVVRIKVAMFTVYGGKERKKKLDRQFKKQSKKFNKDVKNVFEEKEEEVAEQNLEKTDSETTKHSGHDEYAMTAENEDLVQSTESTDSEETVSGDASKEDVITTSPKSDEIIHNADSTEPDGRDSGKHKKPGFFRWLRYLIRRIYKKICSIINGIRNAIIGFYKKLISSKNSIVLKIQTFVEMIESKENRELVAFLWTQLKLVLSKIKPRKCRINLHYGFEDPYTTGQVSMALAVLYGMLGIQMNVNPEFDQEVLEGDIYLKGHVRVFPLLVIALRVYTNKLFRKIILKSHK